MLLGDAFSIMPRRITSNKPEPLSDADIRCFIDVHIPYRLKLLQLGLAVRDDSRLPASPSGVIDSALVESAIIVGRQLIQFLGFGVKHEERPILEPDPDYHTYTKDGDKYTDEVKVTDVRGSFLPLSDLTPEDQSVLAEFYHGASKSTAHLTHGSGHGLDRTIFCRGCALILRLVSTELYRQNEKV